MRAACAVCAAADVDGVTYTFRVLPYPGLTKQLPTFVGYQASGPPRLCAPFPPARPLCTAPCPGLQAAPAGMLGCFPLAWERTGIAARALEGAHCSHATAIATSRLLQHRLTAVSRQASAASGCPFLQLYEMHTSEAEGRNPDFWQLHGWCVLGTLCLPCLLCLACFAAARCASKTWRPYGSHNAAASWEKQPAGQCITQTAQGRDSRRQPWQHHKRTRPAVTSQHMCRLWHGALLCCTRVLQAPDFPELISTWELQPEVSCTRPSRYGDTKDG